MIFPLDDIEFGRCWSSEAGKLSGLRQVLDLIEKRAATAFINQKDEVANELRGITKIIKVMVEEGSAVVNGYINENSRRKKCDL